MTSNNKAHTVQASTGRRDHQAEIDGSETPRDGQEGVSQRRRARAMNQGRFAGDRDADDAA
ncbi:hypothetical protein RB200_23545 [Streptomyces sp. PmtG]